MVLDRNYNKYIVCSLVKALTVNHQVFSSNIGLDIKIFMCGKGLNKAKDKKIYLFLLQTHIYVFDLYLFHRIFKLLSWTACVFKCI